MSITPLQLVASNAFNVYESMPSPMLDSPMPFAEDTAHGYTAPEVDPFGGSAAHGVTNEGVSREETSDDQDGDKAEPNQAICVACANDDPDSVCAMQRCDGGCDRWFCIEGMCASALGIPFDKYLSAGDLVCADCAPPGEKLQVNVNALAAMPEMGFLASDEQ